MSSWLEQIQSPDDLKKLNISQMEQLCKEIRRFLLRSVSKTGGHLASNLGVVELTVALEYCFHLPQDKIVWDVGHQAYIHKILTGRKKDFSSLRQMNGLSGFPKPHESAYDAFAAGHSSTSISAALGIAKARDLKGKRNHVVAVIGDGSMTGGLAYEALNNAGRENTDLIVVLNDNQMSIDTNVGAISKHFNALRTSNRYQALKDNFKQFRDTVPVLGKPAYFVLEKVRDSAKLLLLEGAVFESMGFKYIGPVDGHDLNELIDLFRNVQQMHGPLLIHVKTEKGKGYPYAEERPWDYHGVSPFDLRTGEALSKSRKPTWSDVFGKKIVEIAKHNPKVVAITAAMCSGTGLEGFKREFPKRFFDVAIAEQHGTTFAAGLASQGMIPVFAVYSSFLQRAYDQIVHDVCMENLHVVFAIDRAGIVGADGETHQGVFDLSYLRHIPNMTVLSPKNDWELAEMLEFAVNGCTGPVAVRYPRGTASENFEMHRLPITMGKAEWIAKGEEIAILAEGHMLDAAYEAVELLRKDGKNPSLVNIRFITPLDTEILEDVARRSKYIFTVEDNVRAGGFGSAVLEFYSDKEDLVHVKNLAFPTEYITQGTQAQLFEKYGLSGKGIYQTIRNTLGE